MLVIDRVQLVFCFMSRMRCGNSIVRTPLGLEQDRLIPADEIIQIGNVRQDVVADQQIRLTNSLAIRCAPSRHRRIAPSVGIPFPIATFGDVRRRLDPQNGHACLHEVLEQIAVIAGDFHHLVRSH